MNNTAWNHEFDVVVVGSGNGGMTAAITAAINGASVLLIEKSKLYGGTSASSGGGVWIPNNRYAKAAGAEDSPQDALDYIRHVSPKGKIDDELIKTYVEKGPEMIDFLHENTRARYLNLPAYPDYFPHDPGGKFGNRSIQPEPLHASALGKEFKFLQPQHPGTQMPFGINFDQSEGALILGAMPGWRACAAKLVINYLFDLRMRFKTLRDGRLTMGNAGIARLRLSMMDLNIPLWNECALSELIEENGRVTGIVAQKNNQQLRIAAHKGVILAAGGFERNQAMRDTYLPGLTKTEWSAANLHNTGTAINAATQLGAATEQMDWAWWFTTVMVPGHEKAHLSQVEKSMPGNITVNSQGKRFSNESKNYVTFVEDIFTSSDQGSSCVPCYMIFDSNFRKQRPVGALIQGKFFPDWMVPKNWWSPKFLCKGNSIRELAEKAGIEPDGLEETQKVFNEYAKTGKDLDFQRGDSVYDRYYGDPSVEPNPNLAPIEKPPFYSMAMYPGDMGTAGGLVTDSHARVLKEDQSPIDGLYACGNCTNALLPRYPGPGSTLGPAMTFGYLAGLHINNQTAR